MSYQHVHESPYPDYPPPGHGPPPPQPQGYPPPGMPQPPGFYNGGGYPPPPPPPGTHSYQGYFNDQYPPPPPPQHMYHGGGDGYGYHGDDNGCSSFLRGCVCLKLIFSAVWLLFVVAVFWRSALGASSLLDAIFRILLVCQSATDCGCNLENVSRLLSKSSIMYARRTCTVKHLYC
ncbi:hypothetical protein T459_02311 [Capsicum annuum]|uniref:Cysteine-rich and transmembrane domain-containing protein A-like n=1 Tax=Capsicum annuum TaxID=4072 RepID=A0A2G3AJN0_CAPAN|nr:hypothetical protein T459_02311 [Capsicum annuum]